MRPWNRADKGTYYGAVAGLVVPVAGALQTPALLRKLGSYVGSLPPTEALRERDKRSQRSH
jgi:hypothetical protein